MAIDRSRSSFQDLSSLHRFSSLLLQSAAGQERKGNVLILGNGSLPAPECHCLRRDEGTFGLAICIFQGPSPPSELKRAPLECVSSALPFQDGVFQKVILYLVVVDGAESELDEACRVLAPGGELLVLGLNRGSWSGMWRYRKGPVPRMRIADVKNSLRVHDMEIDHVLGAGLLGRAKPLMDWKRLSGIALPLADLVVLRARHRDRPAATRLRMKRFPARAVPTAISTVLVKGSI